MLARRAAFGSTQQLHSLPVDPCRAAMEDKKSGKFQGVPNWARISHGALKQYMSAPQKLPEGGSDSKWAGPKETENSQAEEFFPARCRAARRKTGALPSSRVRHLRAGYHLGRDAPSIKEVKGGVLEIPPAGSPCYAGPLMWEFP